MVSAATLFVSEEGFGIDAPALLGPTAQQMAGPAIVTQDGVVLSWTGTEAPGRPLKAEMDFAYTDNRTGKQYEIPIEHDTIRAMDLRQIKVKDDDFGLMTYDPAFMNTASCKSKITFIDGDRGSHRRRLRGRLHRRRRRRLLDRPRLPRTRRHRLRGHLRALVHRATGGAARQSAGHHPESFTGTGEPSRI